MQDQVTTMKAPEDASPLPKLLVSSEEAGWEGIVVSAYHEPAELDLKPWFPLVAPATWHKPSCLESARKLRTLATSRLAVGHGPVLNQPLAAMDHAIGMLARELDRKAKKQVTVTKS
jgi:hypothetical protein